MYNACAVLGSDKIICNNAERITILRKRERQKLLKTDSYQFFTFKFTRNLKRNVFLSFMVVFKFNLSIFFGEVELKQVFGKDDRLLCKGIWVISLDKKIDNVFPNGQPGIGWQGPGCGSPCKEIQFTEDILKKKFRFFIPDNLELSNNSVILDHFVSTWLVQLMGT